MKILKKILKITGRSSLLFVLAIAAFLVFNNCSHRVQMARVAPAAEADFNGTLLAASDADQIGTAYADGVVNKLAGVEDSLTILATDSAGRLVRSQIHASNSVVSWPAIVSHSPDGKFAYVAETRGFFAKPTDKVKDVWTDLPKGSLMTVIDISDKQNPKIAQKKAIGESLAGASLNKNGTLLVTGSSEKNKEIVIATLKNGLIDQTFGFPGEGINYKEGNDGGIKTIEFHPSENVIAVNLNTKSVVFYQVVTDNETITVKKIGNPLEVAECWSVGNWTPNGKFFILTDVAWGDGTLGAVTNGPGKLISVQFDKSGSHKIVSEAEVGLSPEGFDLSPDGKLAVVANMRRTYVPKGLPFSLFGARAEASLSLVKINPETGQLQTLGKEYGFEGELPEDAVFDKAGKNVAVAVFNNRHEKQPKQGYIEFWKVANEKLVRTNRKILVTRGVHTLKLMP